MKLHEENRLAVCLQFRSFSGSPYMWVVYCVQQLDVLAKLYITLRQAARRSYSTYVHVSACAVLCCVCVCVCVCGIHYIFSETYMYMYMYVCVFFNEVVLRHNT